MVQVGKLVPRGENAGAVNVSKCISLNPSGTPLGKIPMQVVKQFEHQARQNLCTLNFSAALNLTLPSHETLSVHLREHWRFPQSLDTLIPWSETISVHLEWWQNLVNILKGSDLHPKAHNILLFTDASNLGWGKTQGKTL